MKLNFNFAGIPYRNQALTLHRLWWKYKRLYWINRIQRIHVWWRRGIFNKKCKRKQEKPSLKWRLKINGKIHIIVEKYDENVNSLASITLKVILFTNVLKLWISVKVNLKLIKLW